MNRLQVGSTLLAATLLFGSVGPAVAQTADTLPACKLCGALYVGYGEGDQFIFGAQLHLKTPVPALLLVPEAAIAHGASLLVGAGLHFSPFHWTLRPYAGLSLGFLWDGNDDDATNAFVFTPKGGLLLDAGKHHLMLEYQGVDWLKQYRFLIGLRMAP